MASSNWKDLGIRTASALVLIPLVVAIVVAGGVWFQLFVAVIAVLLAWEWCAIAFPGDVRQFALMATAGLAGALLPPEASAQWQTGAGLVGLWAVLWTLSVLISPRRSKWDFFGVPYVALPAAALIMLRSGGQQGLAAIIMVFVAVWSADILAYFFGRLIGGPKLWPAVSPKKTWAGLAGAVLGGMAGATCVAWGLGAQGLAVSTLVGALIGLVEQGGDLFESAFKRHFGVKDSSNLIPGHGGILDRIDGLVAAAVAAALFGLFTGAIAQAGAGLLAW